MGGLLGAGRSLRGEAESVAARFPPLLVEAERVARSVAQGVHGRRRVGTGEAFWQFRHHRQEDSADMIDWRASARSDQLYVRENEWEAAESVWLWCDGSPSMLYKSAPHGPGQVSKRDRAVVLCLAISSLLVRGGERVAVLGGGRRPVSGRHALERLTEDLLTHHGASPANVNDSHGVPMDGLLPRFSRLMVIGDFLHPATETISMMDHYASRGVRGHLMQVLDPAEEDLPFRGRVKFEGLEGEDPFMARNVSGLRSDYLSRLASLRRELSAAARRRDWTFATHRTDSSAQAAVLALYGVLAGRGQRGRQGWWGGQQ